MQINYDYQCCSLVNSIKQFVKKISLIHQIIFVYFILHWIKKLITVYSSKNHCFKIIFIFMIKSFTNISFKLCGFYKMIKYCRTSYEVDILAVIHCTCSRWPAIRVALAPALLIVTSLLAFSSETFAYTLLKGLHYAKLQTKSIKKKKPYNSLHLLYRKLKRFISIIWFRLEVYMISAIYED